MDLASSTLPAITGTATFSGVVTNSISLTLDTSTSLSTTGIFTYSAIRPILTGVISPTVNPISTSSGTTSTPSTRQILIR